MSTIILIHGGCHGAWCWYKVIPRLESAGHRVLALDLPGHGVDKTPVGGLTMQDFAAAVEKTVDTLDEPAILVGHSMGGFVVELVAEHRPERVAAVVYLSTGAVADGQAPATDDILAPGLAAAVGNVAVDQEAGTLSYPDDEATRIFYGDCDDDDVALALMLLVPESTASLSSPLERTPDRYGSVPRYAIVTLDDVAIAPDLQMSLHRRDGLTDIVTLTSGHSSFFSQPDELARHLLDIAERVPVKLPDPASK